MWFSSDRKAWLDQGGHIDILQPMLGERNGQAGHASGHYFHQDLLVAGLIFGDNPATHLDVGSSIEGFVSHVASFRSIDVADIRPLSKSVHENLNFRELDLQHVEVDESWQSVLCLHTLEHLGLGRYGDQIDPNGHVEGFENLIQLVKRGGRLYVSFPISDRPRVHFNAHRVLSPTEVINWGGSRLALERFDFVDDEGSLHTLASPFNLPPLDYGCGIYTFRRR